MGEFDGSAYKKAKASVEQFNECLDKLRALVEDSKAMPFGKRLYTNYDEVTAALDELSSSAPVAVNSALELVDNAEKINSEARSYKKRLEEKANADAQKMNEETQTRCQEAVTSADTEAKKTVDDANAKAEEILANANSEAERIVKEAQEQADQLVSESTITTRAQAEAERLINEANTTVNETYAAYRQSITNMINSNLSKIDSVYTDIETYMSKEINEMQRVHDEFRRSVNYREN